MTLTDKHIPFFANVIAVQTVKCTQKYKQIKLMQQK